MKIDIMHGMCVKLMHLQQWECGCRFAVEPGITPNIMKARRTLPMLNLAMGTLETAPHQKARVARDINKEQGPIMIDVIPPPKKK